MKEHAEKSVSDEKFAERAQRYPVDTPDTKEAYMIREIFECEYSPTRQRHVVCLVTSSLTLLLRSPLRYSMVPERKRCPDCCALGPARRYVFLPLSTALMLRGM